MSGDRRVIKRSRIGNDLPFVGTAVAWLLMDRFHAPGWFKGVIWTLYAIVWIGAAYSIWNEVERDPFASTGDRHA